jgi:hypothetical protein
MHASAFVYRCRKAVCAFVCLSMSRVSPLVQIFRDDRERYAIRRTYGPHICGDALDIDPTYEHVLTGSWRKDNALQIWEYGTGKNIKDVPQDPMNKSMVCSYIGHSDG